jgi:hypothetical protein
MGSIASLLGAALTPLACLLAAPAKTRDEAGARALGIGAQTLGIS